MTGQSADMTKVSVPDLERLLAGATPAVEAKGAFSLGDYMRASGLKESTAYRHIRRAHAAGIVEPAGYALRQTAHGVWRRTPVWRLVSAPRRKGRG